MSYSHVSLSLYSFFSFTLSPCLFMHLIKMVYLQQDRKMLWIRKWMPFTRTHLGSLIKCSLGRRESIIVEHMNTFTMVLLDISRYTWLQKVLHYHINYFETFLPIACPNLLWVIFCQLWPYILASYKACFSTR